MMQSEKIAVAGSAEMRPSYLALDEAALGQAGHAGLWNDRFCNSYGPAGAKPDADGWKATWLATVSGGRGDAAQLREHAASIEKYVRARAGALAVGHCAWRFVSGTGLPHPTETGLAWHHTLAVPWLPGEAVKGLLQAWLFNNRDHEAAKALAQQDAYLFGSKNVRKPSMGALVFHGGFPVEPVTIVVDVVKPEHPGFMEGGAHAPPADYDTPIAAHFLSVESGRWMFPVVPARRGDGEAVRLLSFVMAALKCALAGEGSGGGAGARTSAGYGYFGGWESGTVPGDLT